MSTRKPADATRMAAAAAMVVAAVVFILAPSWTTRSLVTSGVVEAPRPVITRGRESHAPASPQQQSSQLQSSLAAMQAAPLDPTDRGYAMGSGDVLFTSGRADLKPAAIGNLNRLVTFL